MAASAPGLSTPAPVPATPAPGDQRWRVELPDVGASDDLFGGCRSIERSYIKDKQIGEGTYGEVFLAYPKLPNGQPNRNDQVALKKIRMDSEKEGFPITAIREIKLLKSLKSPNIINLREIVRSQVHRVNNFKGSIYMVFDYMDHDLTGLMERHGGFTVPQIKCYMKQLCNGLHQCHSRGILHRDLKASNLLINNQGQLKLADFGLARMMISHSEMPKFTNRVITLWYRPPELLLGAEHYGPEVDMWSVGCIFAELLVGKPIFNGSDEMKQLDKITSVLGTPTEETMPGVSKLQHYSVLRKDKYKFNLKQHLEQEAKKQGRILPSGALKYLEQLLLYDGKRRMKALDAANDSFLYEYPPACNPKDLPKMAPSHEMGMKRMRQEQHNRGGGRQGQHQDGQQPPKRARHNHQQQGQQPQAYSQQQVHPGGHRGPMPYGGEQRGQMLPPQAVAAHGRGHRGYDQGGPLEPEVQPGRLSISLPRAGTEQYAISGMPPPAAPGAMPFGPYAGAPPPRPGYGAPIPPGPVPYDARAGYGAMPPPAFVQGAPGFGNYGPPGPRPPIVSQAPRLPPAGPGKR